MANNIETACLKDILVLSN